MTTATIDDYTKLIQRYAYVALKKVKKPPDYDFEDLVQEGVVVFLSAKKAYASDRGCSFKSFLTMCLRQHFGSLVSQSYKNKKMTDQEFENRIPYRMLKISHSAFDIVSMMFVLNDFSLDELEYVKTILSYTHKPTKYRRKLTRETLEISYEREVKLRGSIHDKILK